MRLRRWLQRVGEKGETKVFEVHSACVWHSIFSLTHSLPLFVVLSKLFLCYSFFLLDSCPSHSYPSLIPSYFFFLSYFTSVFAFFPPFLLLRYAQINLSLPGFIDAPHPCQNLSISHVFNPSPHNCVEAPSHFLFYHSTHPAGPAHCSPPLFLTAFIFTLESLSYSRPVSHVPGFWCHLYKQPLSDQRHPHPAQLPSNDVLWTSEWFKTAQYPVPALERTNISVSNHSRSHTQLAQLAQASATRTIKI